MSHSTVLVIGKNPEEQLEPFYENWNCPEYKHHELMDEEKQRFVDFYIKKFKNIEKISFEEMYELYGSDYNDNIWKKDEKGIWYEYSTYNQKSRWDWYLLGGRWTGFFKLKKGKKGELGKHGVFDNKPEYDADSALKGDIDFEGMINDYRKSAEERYNKAMIYIGDLPPVRKWKDIIKDVDSGKITIERAREIYRKQPRVKAVRKLEKKDKDLVRDIFGFNDFRLEDYNQTLEEYMDFEGKNCFTTFSVLKDGKWYERGEMGWWGMVANEKEKDAWVDEFYKLVMDLPDDTLLSVYDVHI